MCGEETGDCGVRLKAVKDIWQPLTKDIIILLRRENTVMLILMLYQILMRETATRGVDGTLTLNHCNQNPSTKT